MMKVELVSQLFSILQKMKIKLFFHGDISIVTLCKTLIRKSILKENFNISSTKSQILMTKISSALDIRFRGDYTFSDVLICLVNKKSGNVLPVYTKLILIRHTRGNFDRSYQQFKQFLIKVDLQFENLILDGI